jgi:hypothetical protein
VDLVFLLMIAMYCEGVANATTARFAIEGNNTSEGT